MSSVQKTIEARLRQYPSLYQSAADVLHHVFCVGGNGLDWYGGEMVDRFLVRRRKAITNWSVKKQRAFIKQQDSKDEMLDLARKALRVCKAKKDLEGIARWQAHLDQYRLPSEKEIARRAKDFTLRREEVYPMALTRWTAEHMNSGGDQKYVYFTELLGLPDNIKKDWLEAAELMCKIIREQDKTKNKKQRALNLKVVKMAEKRIAELKGMK